MTDATSPTKDRDAGGTYGQTDVSPAAERPHFRQSQNYRSTASAAVEESEEDGSEPGGPVDAGAS